MDHKNLTPDRVLWIGDALTYLIVTLIGFSSHDLLGFAAVNRILATLLPFYLGWVIFAYWGGSYRVEPGNAKSWLVRSGVTAVLAAPFAATLRGFWLDAPVLPVFVAVMAGVSALGILIWRSLYVYLIRPRVT